MRKHKDSSPVSKQEVEGIIRNSIIPLTERIKTLEDAVFGTRPPGPPGLGERVEDLKDSLAVLDKKITMLDEKYAERTRQIIETVAELRNVVEELRKAQERTSFGERKMEA